MKTPLYLTMSDFELQNMHQRKVLPAGSFVKLISDYYLPPHLKQRSYNIETHQYGYTHFGIILLPLDILRSAE